jgi:tetratricopeptide (TPR) repeat protein
MDSKRFEYLTTLLDPEEVIRECRSMWMEASDDDEKASLLVGIHVSLMKLGRLQEAKQILEAMKHLEISSVETRLNSEFCEPCFLVQDSRPTEALAAFVAMLDRNREALQKPEYRYLYEDIQCRRASVLVDLSQHKEALPILREAEDFTFDQPADQQRVCYQLGFCLYHSDDLPAAKEEFIRVVRFGLKNDYEEWALYFLGIVHYRNGAFAQAVQHLETILQDFPEALGPLPRQWVYELLSKSFSYLGDKVNQQLYADLAIKRGKG